MLSIVSIFRKDIFISFIITRGKKHKLIFIEKTANYNGFTAKEKNIQIFDY